MEITKGVELIRKENGTIMYKNNGVTRTIMPTEQNYVDIDRVYKSMKSVANRNDYLEDVILMGNDIQKNFFDTSKIYTSEEMEKENSMSVEEKLTRGIGNLIKFFTEFEFQPNFRFINTLCKALEVNEKNGRDYVFNYFNLVDNSYKSEIASKMKSAEFGSILKDLSATKPKDTVNKRFKIYYGSQGTGKTTIGMTETDNRIIVCNNSMIPADLMEDFTFNSGNATFKHSALWDCMENGKAIVLDEINLLPFESLRFLQGILDNKKEFIYKGETVHIADGFKIIGTMNLTVNGSTFGLPEPLVDRCAEIKSFQLTAKDLLSAII